MRVELKELNNEELKEVTKLYVEERDKMPWLCSLEEFCECFVRKCESCGEFVTVEDSYEELKIGTNWKGEKYHVCESCYEDSEEYEKEMR